MTNIQIPFLVSGISYMVLLLYEITISIWKARRGSVINIHKLFHTILTLAILGRITYFMLRTFNKWVTPEKGYELLLPDLTSVGFYLTFLVVVFLWAKVSYRARQRFQNKPEKLSIQRSIMLIFWFVVIFCISFVLVVNIISTTLYEFTELYNLIVQTCFFPILSFSTALGFIMFGIFLFCELGGHRREIHSQILRNQLIKIGFLGLIGTISFVLRACVVIVLNILIEDVSKGIDTPSFEMGFYLGLEWLPSIVVVTALNALRWSPHQTGNRSRTPLLPTNSGYLSSHSNSNGYFGKSLIINSPPSDDVYDTMSSSKYGIQSSFPVEPEFVMTDPGDPAYYSGSLSTEDNYITRDAHELVLDSSTDSSDDHEF
eukprot:gb/GECH01011986.1/.p1 GENE.gb/GECH01011986.1/~~gb/GECH01011986.1/.p1  ORF type:complete len:373 (+),score=25.23 gb/GECH01011986.1/:1-1119(+)